MKKPIPIVLVLLGLPLLAAVIEASIHVVVNRSNGTIVSSGREREYLLYVPASYDPAKPTPLVISMHGAAMLPSAQMEVSRWNAVADREGFIVVYPSGAIERGPRIWRADGNGQESLDVRFISDLIDRIQGTHNIDPSRIYANGLSNGGGMAFALSCTLSNRIAAFGMVAAAHLLDWSWCADTRPVPMIAFHGTADYVTPYNGGKSFVAPRPFPDIRGWTRQWARRNRCESMPIESVVTADVTKSEYQSCADEAAVVLYTIIGGGHTWPGGGELPEWALGPVNRNIDASAEMWAFFRQHTRRK